MVRVFKGDVFAGDYGLTIKVETEIGLITLLTYFPRHNKWIGIRDVYDLYINPKEKIEYPTSPNLHIRNLQSFLHRILMKEGLMTDDLTTVRIINKYRRKYED